MRSAKESGCFPYYNSLICYMEVFPDGTINQLQSKTDRLAAYLNAKSNKSKIYAVWPGKWRSDLFLIDDLDAFCNDLNLL